MTKAQKSLYWREWAKVRKTLVGLGDFSTQDADQERHEIHVRALGRDKSSKDFTNRDLDAILDHFRAYRLDLPPADDSRAESQPIKRRIFAIERLGFPDAYVEAIARDVFQTSDWRALPLESLNKLRFTLTRRARRRTS